jgi:NAD-dependent dihydropyrimidine dehydrogenase PreA subunit
MGILIDLEKCNGCLEIEGKEKGTSNCLEECAVECITLVEDDPSTAPHGREQHAEVNNEECTDCEACVDACEQGAISMIEPE